ncbi:hypothetical protein ACI1MP_35525 [Kitasatospora griseola]|uniref:hypothetical protein n=1 Tax=Kitasatospora griseola TaxID=2064 RepID=UPI003855BEDA
MTNAGTVAPATGRNRPARRPENPMTLSDPDRLIDRQVLLAALTEEPACADTAADLLTDPPTESRLGGTLALAGVVVLAAAITRLLGSGRD